MALRSVAVTGGTGFLGSAICRALAERRPDCKIFALDLCPPCGKHALPPTVQFAQADITSLEDVCTAIEKLKPQVIIHSAGLVGTLALRYCRKERDAIWRVNVTGTENVLEAARRAAVAALVYTSSVAAVMDDLDSSFANVDERWPPPRSSLPYGESKAAAENLVSAAMSDTFATCSLRPSVLFGPGDDLVLPRVYGVMAQGGTRIVVGRDHFRLWDITYVTNAADAHMLAAENLVASKTAAGEVFFIQNNEPIPFRDFCLAVWAFFGHVPEYDIHVPVFVALVAGFIVDLVAWLTGFHSSLSYGAVKEYCTMRYANGRKAQQILGYEARVGLDDAVRISCENYARRIGVTPPKPPV